jgi:hypothetical protein
MPRTDAKTDFWNKNHIWWESCPPISGKRHLKIFAPEMGAPLTITAARERIDAPSLFLISNNVDFMLIET